MLTRFDICWIASVNVFGGLVWGSVLGAQGPVITWVGLTGYRTSIFSLIMTTGAVIGAFCIPPIVARRSWFVKAVVGVLGPSIIAAVIGALTWRHYSGLLVSRLFAGMSGGYVCCLAPLYAAVFTPKHHPATSDSDASVPMAGSSPLMRIVEMLFNLFICTGLMLLGGISLLLSATSPLMAEDLSTWWRPEHTSWVLRDPNALRVPLFLGCPALFSLLLLLPLAIAPHARCASTVAPASAVRDVHAQSRSLPVDVEPADLTHQLAVSPAASDVASMRDACSETAGVRRHSVGSRRSDTEHLLVVAVPRASSASGSWTRRMPPFRPCAVAFAMALLAQGTGVNPMVFYAPSLLQRAMGPETASAFVGVWNVVSVIVGLFVARLASHRTLVIATGAVGVMADAVLAVAFAVQDVSAVPNALVTALFIGGYMIYFLAFQAGFGTLFYALAPLLWPSDWAEVGGAVANGIQLVLTGVMVAVFPVWTAHIAPAGLFGMLTGLGAAALAATILLVPRGVGQGEAVPMCDDVSDDAS
eukprot:TRINITY_DN21304_c0_g1_i1.p1 TRINITY_DN21304_c0_g1~~TRINITY_DN21304_c0_g1_i1.p1  ORF type:complete len:530 (+),score=105.59 TRINITY_DN21304_c0_g1_i1:205-1794(+)